MKKEKLERYGHSLLKSDNLLNTFLRSAVSSQTSGWVDFICRFVFFTWILSGVPDFYRSNLSVAIGAILGGVVNCLINYKFTFHASGQAVRAVAVKFFLVWAGSLLLNMYGTTFCAQAMSHWTWLLSLGFTEVGIFTAATLGVSLLVSWFWNFLLQRYFVFRPTRFDAYAMKITRPLARKRLR